MESKAPFVVQPGENIRCLVCNTFLSYTTPPFSEGSMKQDAMEIELHHLQDSEALMNLQIPIKEEMIQDGEVHEIEEGWFEVLEDCSPSLPKHLGPDLLQFVSDNFELVGKISKLVHPDLAEDECLPFCEACVNQLSVLQDLWIRLVAMQDEYEKMNAKIKDELQHTYSAVKLSIESDVAPHVLGHRLRHNRNCSDSNTSSDREVKLGSDRIAVPESDDEWLPNSNDVSQDCDDGQETPPKKLKTCRKRATANSEEVVSSLDITLSKYSVSPCVVKVGQLKVGPHQKGVVPARANPNPQPKTKRKRDYRIGGPFPCAYCPKLLSTKETRRIHTRLHTGERPFACQFCPKTFYKQANLTQHLVTHNKVKKHSCHICGSKFLTSTTLANHLGNAHGIMSNTHSCDLCSKKFMYSSRLKAHISTAHFPQPKLKVHDETNSKKDVKDEQQKWIEQLQLQCDACEGCHFASTELLNDHFVKQHRVGPDGQGLFTCDTCMRRFVLEENHNQHVCNTFNCKDCQRSFKSYATLSNHMERGCRGKPLVCEICGHVLRNRKTLEWHIRTQHKGERRHQCAECGASFAAQNCLNAHMVQHTGKKVHPCEFCEERFNRFNRKREHQVKVHAEEYLKYKPVYCSHCWVNFISEDELSEHVAKIHDKYTCKTCDPPKVFSTAAKYQTHLRVHTGDKPFKCSHCSRSFTQQYNLQEHVNRHTGERPYKCEQCGAGFFRKKELGNHVQKVHN